MVMVAVPLITCVAAPGLKERACTTKFDLQQILRGEVDIEAGYVADVGVKLAHAAIYKRPWCCSAA